MATQFDQTPGRPTRSDDAVDGPGTRERTDKGLLGDKIPVEDPATAPLGTDAEAGGAPSAAATHRSGLDGPARYPEGQAAGEVPARGSVTSGALWGVIGAVVLLLVILLAADIL